MVQGGAYELASDPYVQTVSDAVHEAHGVFPLHLDVKIEQSVGVPRPVRPEDLSLSLSEDRAYSGPLSGCNGATGRVRT